MDILIDPLTGRPVAPGPQSFMERLGTNYQQMLRASAANPIAPNAGPIGGAAAMGAGMGGIAPQPPAPPAQPAPAALAGATVQAGPEAELQVEPTPAPNPPAGAPQGPEQLPTPPVFQPPPDTRAAPVPQAARPAPGAAQPGALMAPTVGPDMGEDDIDAFARRLVPAESGGRADAMNSGGYAGLFQFGAPRLQTLGVYTPGQGEDMRGWGAGGGRSRANGAWTGTFNIPGFENVRTIQDFLSNPDAQRAVFRAHMRDIDQTIDSIPEASAFDRNGLRSVAHLGGPGGMQRFIANGGQSNTADGNGTTLSAYYQRFAGTDAPNGLQARQGGAPAPAPDSAKPAPAPQAALPTGGATFSPTVAGMPAQALLAAGSAMMGAPNAAQGLGAAGQAFVRQANTERAFDQSRLDRAEQRADRQQTRADANSYRNAQVEMARARLAAAGNRAGSTGVHSSVVLQDPETGTQYRSSVGRDNRQTVTTLDGQPVTDRAIVDRLQQRDPGAAAQARDDIEQRNAAFEQTRGARTLRPSIAAARRVLDEDPNLTGPDVGTRVLNAVVESLGIPVGQRTPENIAMLRQALQQGNMQTLMQLAPSLRPMSNVDLQAISQMSPSLMTNPRMIRAWLDQMDAAAERAERMGADLARAYESPETARAIARTGGVSAWRERWEANDAATRRPNGQVRSPVQPGTNAQGQPEWQHRSSSGVGFSFN